MKRLVRGFLAASHHRESLTYSKFLFGIYLVHFATLNRVISHANAIAVLLFVLWIYLTALLFLLGGEIAKAVEEHRQGI